MRRLLATIILACCAIAAHARGLSFSETMGGYAYQDGEFRNASVALRVTIADIDAWSRNLNTPATITGTLYIDRLPAQPITGTLVILAPAVGESGRLLTYRFTSATLQFTGVKHVQDQAGTEVFDDMTTLHGLFQPKGAVAPTAVGLIGGAQWSSELHFAWWDPGTVASFIGSFSTISTPWWQVLEVEGIFARTMFGALASTLFGGLI